MSNNPFDPDFDPRDRIAARAGPEEPNGSATWNEWRVTAGWNDDDEPTSLTFSRIDGAAFAPSALRRIPLGGMVDAIHLARRERAAMAAEGGRWKNATKHLVAEEQTGPRRGRPLGDEILRKVADTYTEAKMARLPAIRSVAERFGVSERTAEDRIRAARKAGLL